MAGCCAVGVALRVARVGRSGLRHVTQRARIPICVCRRILGSDHRFGHLIFRRFACIVLRGAKLPDAAGHALRSSHPVHAPPDLLTVGNGAAPEHAVTIDVDLDDDLLGGYNLWQ